MGHKDRALGLVSAVVIIFIASVIIRGFGGEINYGILSGPLVVALLEYRKYKKTIVTMRNDEGDEILLSGPGANTDTIKRFEDMGYRRLDGKAY